MSEEVKEGMSTLKKTILGVVTTAVTGAGVYITTNINKIFGVEDETEAKVEQLIENQQAQQATPAPIVLNIDNSSQNNSTNSGGSTNTIIKETVREVPATQPAPAAAPVEEKKETPQERMARLKKQREDQNGGN
jgi:electron transfer flavoprotein alpha/beta subunit